MTAIRQCNADACLCRSSLVALLAPFFVFLAIPSSAYAWGTLAHRVIAQIATLHLSPYSRAELAELSPTRSLADLANDPDHWRDFRPETRAWHYVNIPFAASHYESDRDCANGDCVIAAISHYRGILADRRRSRDARYEALAFLVHFIADAHQPLHCINNDDRGGNDVSVTFFGIRTNLHAVWDSEILARTRLGERAYIRRLTTWLASQNLQGLTQGTIVDWVLSAHALARDHAYHLPANNALQSGYYKTNRPIIEAQLAKAAIRTAHVLNEALQPRGKRP